jgi:hypothetical protein
MTIDNLHFKSIRSLPPKADPPLIVDADAVLSLPIPTENLQAVSWWRSKIAKFDGTVQLAQFPASHLLEGGKAQDALAVVKLLRVAAAEGPDHIRII